MNSEVLSIERKEKGNVYQIFSEVVCCNGASRIMVLLGWVAISIPLIVICKKEKRKEKNVSD